MIITLDEAEVRQCIYSFMKQHCLKKEDFAISFVNQGGILKAVIHPHDESVVVPVSQGQVQKEDQYARTSCITNIAGYYHVSYQNGANMVNSTDYSGSNLPS